METFQFNLTENAGDPEFAPVMRRWFSGWSPGQDPWIGAVFREVFEPGAGAIEVVDNIGADVVQFSAVEQYISHWEPFMQMFSYWTIKPIGPIRARMSGTLATVALSFEAEGRDAKGNLLDPPPGQHGSFVLVNGDHGWRIVREHLLTFSQPRPAGD